MRVRTWVPWVAGIVLLYVVALVWKAPASVALFALPDNVQLQGVEGRIWSGRVATATINLENEQYRLHQINWTLNPWSLLTLSPSAQIQIDRHPANVAHGEAEVQVGSGAVIQVSNARLISDMERIERASPWPFIMPLRGDITLNLAEWRAQGEDTLCNTLDGQLMVMNVTTRLEQRWEELGNYHTDLSCENNRIHLQTDADNPLGLELDGWVAMTGMDIDVAVRPGPEAPRALVNMLEWTGRADDDGRRTFRLQL